MKKIIVLGVLLSVTVGCTENESPKDVDGVFDNEVVVCREGKKIWVATVLLGRAGSITSQIVGDCDE